jgi:hypothetical protein
MSCIYPEMGRVEPGNFSQIGENIRDWEHFMGAAVSKRMRVTELEHLGWFRIPRTQGSREAPGGMVDAVG